MKTAILAALAAFPIAAAAEWRYEMPYLGPEPLRASDAPLSEVSEATLAADSIVLATSRTLDLSGHDSSTGEGVYRGELGIDEVLKGRVDSPIELSWRPSATGIEAGSRHLFFIHEANGELEVLKEIYVHREGYPCCRTYGAMDGGTASTLAVIRALLEPDREALNAAEMALLEDIESEKTQRQWTAVMLAAELNRPASIPALRSAIGRQTDGFFVAIRAFCRIDGARGAASGLSLLGADHEFDRHAVARVFNAIAMAENADAVEQLLKFGTERPEHRVSCAFAIRNLDPDRLPEIVRAWEADGKHEDRIETLSTGLGPSKPTTSDLLKSAVSGEKYEF